MRLLNFAAAHSAASAYVHSHHRNAARASAGGAHVAGMWLPAGMLVSLSAYKMQQMAHVFPAPDEWNPARWLVEADGATASAAIGGGPEAAADNETEKKMVDTNLTPFGYSSARPKRRQPE
jgi:cytochrome P450